MAEGGGATKGRGGRGGGARGGARTTFIVGSIDQMLLLPSWSTEMPRRPEVGPLSSAMRKGESRDTCARARVSGAIARAAARDDARLNSPRTARRGAQGRRSAAPAQTRRPEPRWR